MNIQKIARILCLLLAVLILFNTVFRPLEVQATAIATTAAVVGISVEAAIPWIFSALSVAYLYSFGSQLYYSVKSALTSKTTTISGTTALKAYSYNGSYCLDSSVIESATSVIDSYVTDYYSIACTSGLQFSNLYTIYIQNSRSSNDRSIFYYWGNTDPVFSQDNDGDLSITFYKPCVVLRNNNYYDYSASYHATPTAGWTITNHDLHSVVKQSSQSVVSPDVSEKAQTLAATGIWIVDTTSGGDSSDGGKKRVLPIIATDSIENTADVVETEEEVEVDISTSGSSSNTGSSTDLSGVLGWLQRIWSAITDLPSSIASPIVSGLQSFYDMIEYEFGLLQDDYADFSSSVLPVAILDVVEHFWTGTVENIQNIKTTVKSISTSISGIGKTITTSISDALTDFWTDVKTAVLSIPDVLTDIWEWIQTIPQVLVDALVSVFVPAEGYLDAKVDTLLANYTFLKSFYSDSNFLMRRLLGLGSTPPVITIPLGNSNTSYSLGNDVVFLDLSWYADYKPTVDSVLSALIWVLFVWKTFLKLPGLVRGLPGEFGKEG